MSDRYGIPDNMFGIVPEPFYALIGRVAMVAAMLEDRLLGLLWTLNTAPQSLEAGRSGTELVKRCRNFVTTVDPALQPELTELLDSVEEALTRRHTLVHSLWADPTLEHAKGWRHVRGNKRTEPWDPAVWVETSETAMADLLQTMVRLAARCDLMSALAGGFSPARSSRG